MKNVNELIRHCNYIAGANIRSNKKTLLTHVYGRAVFYSILRQLFPRISLHKMGKFVNRDHATVIHSLRKTADTYVKDPLYQDMYQRTLERYSKDPKSFKPEVLKLSTKKLQKNIQNLEKNVVKLEIENKELKARLANKKLLNIVSDIPEEHIEDFITHRLVPYTKMIKYKKDGCKKTNGELSPNHC